MLSCYQPSRDLPATQNLSPVPGTCTLDLENVGSMARFGNLRMQLQRTFRDRGLLKGETTPGPPDRNAANEDDTAFPPHNSTRYERYRLT